MILKIRRTLLKGLLGVVTITNAYAQKIDPYEHIHQGCPENSLCSEKTADIYQKWRQLKSQFQLKKLTSLSSIEAFRKKYGIPMPLWQMGIPDEKLNAAYWNSHCSNHRSKDPQKETFVAEFFAKNSQSLPKQFQLEPMYLLSGKTILEFLLPRNTRPFKVSARTVEVLLEDDGLLYGLQMSNNGQWKVINPSRSPSTFIETPCPQKLIEKFTRHQYTNTLYQKYFCRKYNNEMTTIHGWTCQ